MKKIAKQPSNLLFIVILPINNTKEAQKKVSDRNLFIKIKV